MLVGIVSAIDFEGLPIGMLDYVRVGLPGPCDACRGEGITEVFGRRVTCPACAGAKVSAMPMVGRIIRNVHVTPEALLEDALRPGHATLGCDVLVAATAHLPKLLLTGLVEGSASPAWDERCSFGRELVAPDNAVAQFALRTFFLVGHMETLAGRRITDAELQATSRPIEGSRVRRGDPVPEWDGTGNLGDALTYLDWLGDTLLELLHIALFPNSFFGLRELDGAPAELYRNTTDRAEWPYRVPWGDVRRQIEVIAERDAEGYRS